MSTYRGSASTTLREVIIDIIVRRLPYEVERNALLSGADTGGVIKADTTLISWVMSFTVADEYKPNFFYRVIFTTNRYKNLGKQYITNPTSLTVFIQLLGSASLP